MNLFYFPPAIALPAGMVPHRARRVRLFFWLRQFPLIRWPLFSPFLQAAPHRPFFGRFEGAGPLTGGVRLCDQFLTFATILSEFPSDDPNYDCSSSPLSLPLAGHQKRLPSNLLRESLGLGVAACTCATNFPILTPHYPISPMSKKK